MHPDARQGIILFSQRKFYQAHENFESAWRETKDNPREFYRALLQLSGGYYRLTQKRLKAAKKFFKRSLHWLHNYPDPFFGIETSRLKDPLIDLIGATDIHEKSIFEDVFSAIQDLFEEKP